MSKKFSKQWTDLFCFIKGTLSIDKNKREEMLMELE